MEQRLADALKRLGEADRALRDHGQDPQPFLLIYSAAGPAALKHPAWDGSWPLPTAGDIDDLEELGYLRVEPGKLKRTFSLTVAGRRQALALAQAAPSYAGGRAPALDEVLQWLIELERESPEAFEIPTRILDAAVRAGFIAPTGREELAKRIVALYEQGYLDGDLLDIENAGAEQRLGLPGNTLALTMKAHDRARAAAKASSAPRIEFHGSVIANQIAAGDINNYNDFGELLDTAETALTRLDDVDDVAREEAHRVIEVLRGKGVDASVALATGTGGALLARVLGQLIGLPA